MKRPNIILYTILGFLLKIYAFFDGHRLKKHDKVKGPAIVLSNHTSFHDFIYTTNAVYPRRINYLAAHKMFHEPSTRFFLKMARAIPKSLLQADPVATLKAFRILKKKGIIGIFPEGQISPIGTTLPFSLSIAKFIKKAKVNVFLAKHKNAYLAHPPWSKYHFRGRVDTSVELLLSKHDIDVLSTGDIHKRVTEGLYFKTSLYNQQMNQVYKVKDIKNLENVIYQCPKCMHEGLNSQNDRLVCPSCHDHLIYDQYGRINQLSIDALYDNQRQFIVKEIEKNHHFEWKEKVILQMIKNDYLQSVGFGTLTLNKHAIVYDGMIDAKLEKRVFEIKNIQSLPSDIGKNVQIYEGYQIFQFQMDRAWMPTKFVIATEYLHEKALNNQ
jgi:ribosomal protein S27AE